MFKGTIFARFRRINIILFALAFGITAIVMISFFNMITSGTSAAYAERYTVSTAEALSAHIQKELWLISKAAGSSAVIEWMLDEDNEVKKIAAYQEMTGIVDELYSYNLYVGLESSRAEYNIDNTEAGIYSIGILSEDNKNDAWYFACIESDSNYLLSVDRDHLKHRKRVWLDYKVVKDGVPLGVICTGLEFSHVAGELFSKYEKDNMRGIIIDSNGYVHMDSSLMDNREFLHQDYSPPITDLINDPKVLSALNSYLDAKSEKERFDEIINIVSSSDTYRYITVSPIHNTDWSVIILSGSLAFFDRSQFLPVAIIILILLLLFAAVTSIFNYRLIFRPLNKLSISLDTLKDEMGGEIYGLKRNDEIGYLAQTINDLFNKANLDALTGIYNRRFMENNLDHTMEILKRSNSNLSVLMIDIDFFKKYNDTYGHKQGDACLKEVAGVMAATAQRTIDFAARYGGEEFIVVLPSTDENGARVIAEELLSGVRGLEIPHSGNAAAPHVTVSVGITTGKVLSGQSWGDYVKCADEALYISKNSGRNRCSFKMLGGDSAN